MDHPSPRLPKVTLFLILDFNPMKSSKTLAFLGSGGFGAIKLSVS